MNLWLKMIEEDDKTSFESLFLAYNSRLIRFAINWVKHREIAEELVLDLFMKIWREREKMRAVKSPEGFLYVSTRNLCLNYVRLNSKKIFEDISEHSDFLVDSDDNAGLLEYKEMCDLVNQAVERLPSQCKLVFQLVRYEQMSYSETAEALNLSVNTVRTQMVRALKKLHALLDPYLGVSSKY